MTVSDSAVLWFRDINLEYRLQAGGKGASLGELCRAGISVPDGFVVSTIAFKTFLDELDSQHNIRARVSALDPDDLDAVNRCTEELRQLVKDAELPTSLKTLITDSYATLGEQEPVAVRSSATSEDSEEASFAGLQDTWLWVRGIDDVLRYVQHCWASLYSPESVIYRLRLNLPESALAMAVVVQRMVNSVCSGVMFTRSPTTGDRSVLTIESSWGLGSSIVSGEVTPDRFVVNKITGDISVKEIAEKGIEHVPDEAGGVIEREIDQSRRSQVTLDDEMLRVLLKTAKQVEQHYGCAQDIEWAIDQKGELLLLQSRPETVWATKDRAPVAKPAARAFDHIFNVLGGSGN